MHYIKAHVYASTYTLVFFLFLWGILSLPTPCITSAARAYARAARDMNGLQLMVSLSLMEKQEAHHSSLLLAAKRAHLDLDIHLPVSRR